MPPLERILQPIMLQAYWCQTAMLIRIFVLALLSKRKTGVEICSISNLPSKQTQEIIA